MLVRTKRIEEKQKTRSTSMTVHLTLRRYANVCGPFIPIPLILTTMNGPQAMLGWLLGALVAICDGLVWAELGAAMPGTGGPYRYFSEAFGPKRLGRLMSFLFIWETVCLAPLSVGAGAVGFAQYTKFLWPHMNWWAGKGAAGGVCA